jgi:hypothetical protein
LSDVRVMSRRLSVTFICMIGCGAVVLRGLFVMVGSGNMGFFERFHG